jgi:MHS family proline/betaine transporter-like MFS transporter
MKIKQIFITSLGNTLEWLDFGLFIFFAPIIGAKFFPSTDLFTSKLSALSVFAAGFICRPLGGILFGHVGDVHGRANTLRLSILMISISTFLIGCLPGYQSIGITATILFIVLRLIQGLSVGGEYSGVLIYLAEFSSIQHRGFITSFAAMGANIGFLLSTLLLLIINKIIPPQIMQDWGWRLPFLLIGCLGSILCYLRFKLSETPIFSYLTRHHHLQTKPFLNVLRYAPSQLLKVIGMTCMGASLYYIFFGYMASYLSQNLGIDQNSALLIQSFFLGLMLLLIPMAGFCGDKLGRKSVLIHTAIATILLATLCFWLLQLNNIVSIFAAMSIATLLSSFDQGNTLCAVVENFPSNVRYTGIAFSYNVGNAIFGGTAPLIFTVLTEKLGFIAPAFYLMIMTFFTLMAAITLLSKVNINQYLQTE